MTVRELLATVDKDLLVTVYGRGKGKALLDAKGTYDQNDEESVAELLSKFGNMTVLESVPFHNFLLVRLDD